MKLSSREMTLGFVTLAVVIAAGTWMWAEPRLAAIGEVRKQKESSREIIARSEQLLAREDQWRARLDTLREQLPRYGTDERVSASIMKMLETRAADAGLVLLKATPERERRVGELYEIAINYRWEGSLNSLVRFLYNLQSESVHLEIGQLSAGPTPGGRGQGELAGGFTVDVAYTRADGPAAAEAKLAEE